MTYRLTFDITARNADASELLDRLIEFQQQLVEEIEEDEDWNGNIIENIGDEFITPKTTRLAEIKNSNGVEWLLSLNSKH